MRRPISARRHADHQRRRQPADLRRADRPPAATARSRSQAGGGWTYTASSAHDEFVAGTTYTDTFNVASADGTTTSVTINILGTNDAAVLSQRYPQPDRDQCGRRYQLIRHADHQRRRQPADLRRADRRPAATARSRSQAGGGWTYTASSAHDEFVAGTTYTDTFNVASADGTATCVTINILGTNDAAVLSQRYPQPDRDQLGRRYQLEPAR